MESPVRRYLAILILAAGATVALAQNTAPATQPATHTAATRPAADKTASQPPATSDAESHASGGSERTAHAKPRESLDLMSMVFVFMLASFIGLGVILRVSRLLHTPLMSITNAISAIAVVGAILVAGHHGYPWYITLMGTIAVAASMTNIVSGFLITDRMLKMFKTRGGGRS